MADVYHCSKKNRQNSHRLNPLLFPITYESAEVINSLDLPRKYTSTHNDDTREIYLSIGHTYNDRLLSSEEAVKVESQIVGKWISKGKKYEIHLEALVSTDKNPQSEIRNRIICSETSPVLEGIALAETCLLTLYPSLARTKIFIHFKSKDPKYNRIEYWGKLSRWM